jgi:endo-1,4-beta-mannosidase
MKSSKVQIFLDETQDKLNPFTVLKSVINPDNGWVNDIRISINTLKEVGRVLDMDLVYGFISRHNSLEDMIEERAREIAEEVILKTGQTMQQDNLRKSENEIKKAIQQKTYEISSKMPTNLWD